MGADFTDLIAWREAVELAKQVLSLVRVVRGPGSAAVCDQLIRAAESVPANIAEGYGRGSWKDFSRFVFMAAASAAETESHLRVAMACGRLSADQANPVIQQARRVRAITAGLAKSLKRRASS